MRPADKLRMLREIVDIRDLQKEQAQAEAIKATEALNAKERAKAACERELDIAEDGWQAAVVSNALATGVAASWSVAVTDAVTSIRQADEQLVLARHDVSKSATRWHDAVLCHAVSMRLATAAARTLRRKREEMLLQETSDRHGLQRTRQ